MQKINLHPKFKPLYRGDTPYYILTGGRGGGKTFVAKDYGIRASFERGRKLLVTRYSMAAADRSIVPEFLNTIEEYKLGQNFHSKEAVITNNLTKAQILFSGIKTSSGNQTAKLKGIPDLTDWIYEEMEEDPDENTFDTIDETVRSTKAANKIILILNPSFRSKWFYKRWFAPHGLPDEFTGRIGNVTYIHHNYLDNVQNLSTKFLQRAEEVKVSNPLRYNWRYLGHWLDDKEGLLWNMALINQTRITFRPPIVRSVVAVDPAITAKPDSDETGIVVVGIDGAGHGYLLDDASGRYTPNEWASKALELKRKHQCQLIVAEVNQGGDMVQSIIQNIDSTCPVVKVHATKGKFVRAEPVYAFYQQGRFHHVGYFPTLEAQLVSWNPDNEKSPDRMDALVWGATYLLNSQGSSTSQGATEGRVTTLG